MIKKITILGKVFGKCVHVFFGKSQNDSLQQWLNFGVLIRKYSLFVPMWYCCRWRVMLYRLGRLRVMVAVCCVTGLDVQGSAARGSCHPATPHCPQRRQGRCSQRQGAATVRLQQVSSMDWNMFKCTVRGKDKSNRNWSDKVHIYYMYVPLVFIKYYFGNF